MLVELLIHATASISSNDHQSMVLLKEKEGTRMLPILMSLRRAMMLTLRTQVPLPSPVPLSVADVSWHLLRKFGIKITRVELTAIKEGTFFSRIVGERDGEEKSLDICLAQDGLVMATTACCPIYVEEELLNAQYMRKVSDNSFSLNINILTRQMLEDALQAAVAQENYEAASKLRDELARRPPTDPADSTDFEESQ